MIDGHFEFRELVVVAVGQAVLFHELPKSLDTIEIRALGRKKKKFDSELCRPKFGGRGMLVAGIVHDQGASASGCSRRISQKSELSDRHRVDVAFGSNGDRFLCVTVDGPENGVSLPARGSLKNLLFEAPKMPDVSVGHKVGCCVHEKDLTFTTGGPLLAAASDPSSVKIELKLMIGFSRNWNAFAALAAHLLHDVVP